MITSLEIRGFKRFESESFELRPLTVLTGVNGGGKSTMLQSLLLARLAETARGVAGDAVRLNGPLRLALGEARDVLNWATDAREITVRLGGPNGEQWVYVLGLPDSEQALHLNALRLPVQSVPGIGRDVVDPAFTYLCAERLGPRDTLSVSAEEPDRIGVGVQGEFTAQVLALRESRAVSHRGPRGEVRGSLHHPDAAGPQLRLQTEAWASEIIRPLQITARVAVGILAGTIRFSEPGLSGEEIRPVNTGFGVSYALPVIVAGLLTEPGDLLIVENPEAHLHPAGQSRLGRFLARVAGSGVQVLVETHSDHVLNGARLAVAQDGSLLAQDMITHYFDHDRTLPIDINDKGELSHWPSGFFDQIETDLGGWPVPDAAGDGDDYRVVVGEESFDWRELADADLPEALGMLAKLLEPLADGRKAAFMNAAYDVECRPSVSLIDALYSPDGGLPRDVRARLQTLLGKCKRLDPDEADLPQPVRVADGPWREPSWGTAHALARAAEGRAMSCLLAPYAEEPDWPSGWVTFTRTTETGQDEVKAHVLRSPKDAPDFWRGVFTHEPVSAEHFFTLTEDAFPRLLFAETLRLHHFKGSYAEVLPWLVKLLGALNDHFARTLADCCGDQNQVMARFSALGLDISPESSNTKKNAKAWEQRKVVHGDAVYRCEWHGKRLWDRDRVHFSLPLAEQGDRVLIGIFVEHLAT